MGRPLTDKTNRRDALLGRLSGSEMTKSKFNKEKWLPLVYIPVRISHYCCSVMKKGPLHKYQTANKLYPIIGTMAEESRVRRQGWLRHGCNAFDGRNSKSQPMSFWTEQDVLSYIDKYGLEIPSVYGEIIEENGILKTTGVDRTGCIFCGFGLHLEKGETRFQRLKLTHPKQYDYCIGGGQWVDNPDYIEDCPEYDGDWKNWNPERIWVPSKDGLGFGEVFRMCNEIYGSDFYRWE